MKKVIVTLVLVLVASFSYGQKSAEQRANRAGQGPLDKIRNRHESPFPKRGDLRDGPPGGPRRRGIPRRAIAVDPVVQ